jgi:hypothetical protein
LPNGGAGAFAIASVNLGVSEPIIVSADTGPVSLPVTTTLCQTDPGNGQCLSAPSPTVSLSFAAGAEPTFSVFLQSSGAIPFAPATSRIFVRFKAADGDFVGLPYGGTSVAIETAG